MCAPRVKRHTSIQYSSSCHTRINMGASKFFTAAMICVNYDDKQVTGKKFLSCSFFLYQFCKYVSYGFPIKNFCNPGVHYGKSCLTDPVEQGFLIWQADSHVAAQEILCFLWVLRSVTGFIWWLMCIHFLFSSIKRFCSQKLFRATPSECPFY
jgi:hypothetical protein